MTNGSARSIGVVNKVTKWPAIAATIANATHSANALPRNLATARMPGPIRVKAFDRFRSQLRAVDHARVSGELYVAQSVAVAGKSDLQRDAAAREHRNGRRDLPEECRRRDRRDDARAARQRLRFDAALVSADFDRMFAAHDDEIHIRAAIRFQFGVESNRT